MENQEIFHDWKLAFLFNVKHEKLEDGNVTRCELELSRESIHNAHYLLSNILSDAHQFMQHLSYFAEYDIDLDKYCSLIRNYFASEYA